MTTPTRATGTERELLETMLDQARADLIGTVRGLSETDARTRLVPSLTTPITLIKHATFAERMWFQRTLGRLTDEDCDGPLWAHGGFEVGDDETMTEVIVEFERASARARSIAARIPLDEAREHPHTARLVSLRWIYVFMIAEFARYAGHADILREQIEAR
ncbi:mini-circle protein [Nocardia nova]|uniref:Mini-circle protein n=1 Tax=Nocardia nova TaxID=37330 RepID=A0A2S6ALF0_9NOCA|nr:DinB family protein [Nocardia nova]PPJ26853.1 mini-circle protein [Nocardia nova]PPJ36023.1 mini-circle protein [Nocardia nova]